MVPRYSSFMIYDDERRLLAGMARARFGLYLVEEVLPGFGVRVRDLLSEQVYELADVGLLLPPTLPEAIQPFPGHVC